MAEIVAYISMGSSPDGNLHVAIVELKTFNKVVLIELSIFGKESKSHQIYNLCKYYSGSNREHATRRCSE